MSGPLLEVSGLRLRFGGLTALDSVGLEVAQGQIHAVIGPNGSGKTSLLNCLNLVYRPERGSIRLGGTELVGRAPAEAAAMGLARTFQNVALFPGLDVLDNLMLGRHHLMRTGFLAGAVWLGRARREEAAHRSRCGEIAELLDLARYGRRPAGVLPLAVQKRIELGRALAMEPRLILLDEPAAGASREEAGDMAGALLDTRASLGTSMILVEHDMALVAEVADRVTVLDFGRVIATGTATEIRSDPGVVSAYLGTSRHAPAPAGGDDR